MPTSYVRKLAKKHGVSTSTAEKHWASAKAAAKKEGKGDNFAYVTSIFKNMMHEHAYIPSLKDLTNGMTFKYFLVAEADEENIQRQRSPIYMHLASRFPQFNELPFKVRREIEKEVQSEGLLDDYNEMSQEEKDNIDEYLHDMVIDKMQADIGQGVNIGDWKGEDEYKKRQQYQHDLEDALDDENDVSDSPKSEVPAMDVEKKKRFSAGPRHIAAMRQQHIPTDKAAFAPVDSDEIGPPVKSYYKPWSALTPEQRAARSSLAKKHGTIYRVKNAGWFKAMPPAQQEAVLSVLRSGGSVADARQAAM